MYVSLVQDFVCFLVRVRESVFRIRTSAGDLLEEYKKVKPSNEQYSSLKLSLRSAAALIVIFPYLSFDGQHLTPFDLITMLSIGSGASSRI